MIRFIDLIAIVEKIPGLPDFPKECINCGNHTFDSTSMILLGYNGTNVDFAVACPKCGFSNMKVDIPTDTIKTNEEVPTEILPQDILNFANIKKLLSKNAGDVVTAEDIFGKKNP